MKTWLITGCSSGFGQRLALAAAHRGDQVIATARNGKTIEEMAEPFGGRMITLPLDVTDAAAAKAAVEKAVETFGGFDVLVNNAGYGLFGAIEEGTPEEYRPMFEVNVFGLIETTRAALPILRRSGGTIVNMSSGAGIAGSGGAGYYNAAKFAVEGISEALAGELKPFGIRVLIVEPGPFRTDFLGRSITMAANEMPEYAASSRKDYRETNNGHQAGDPDKAIAVILRAVDADDVPLHLPLGPIAHSIAERKLASFRRDIDAWRDITIATDFDQP
ncbi:MULTISPECIES: oxidoreductase [Rhizobium]|uniref:NAD(P)-dependent dehydrogenase (Short-subunit alcohol dehydrogenase family) n=1 Tax=Rhizobium tropici TaxID=398 RepID=A0A6P1C4Z5_RHITR|nr:MULTISPECIES: oxidoreductase [Rhizobium]AGB73167.1 short-chain dehydrogenase/reductase [Rhizobium tropici CIAT 899]MBB4243675.1 NAD(P)-dependent dehydrogenase (short-subunit alcohol dehydrogenase family) [Rhizobium tropici]MBB5595876.1 NAD(P)-dependent dehydrogenase (short-subunit alcohol dehydrogenase family) [Rhizobium tropici]MBB6493868.1 NAD(P)-dependent dehydrogenase (short-subunit alcohol dehydrogenase family) [Rhizobium tropici]NEV11312.1 SDR family NAD(P)-dependent oxidoreductase [R